MGGRGGGEGWTQYRRRIQEHCFLSTLILCNAPVLTCIYTPKKEYNNHFITPYSITTINFKKPLELANKYSFFSVRGNWCILGDEFLFIGRKAGRKSRR
jgi:hypothetical protein